MTAADDTPVEELIARIPGWEDRPVEVEAAIPVLASPSWRGVDGAPLIARDRETGATLFVKRIHPDTGFYIDVAASFEAAARAGALGIGPAVLLADLPSRTLVCEDLSRDWRVVGLEHAADPAFVDRMLAAHARFAEVGPLPRKAAVFEEVATLHARLSALEAPAPPDMAWLFDTLMLAGAPAAAGAEPPVAIHGDGNLSNVLVNAAGEIRLVDFDRAGMGNPLEAIGSTLVEICAFESDARRVFLGTACALWGLSPEDPEAAFDRMRLFAVADDLRWALIAFIMAHDSPRKTEHEFYKFGMWRFLRARIALRDPRYGERLRGAA